jgi:LacI family transcriptional regulator
MAKAVRMADIAERLNISIVSVSKALAGKDGVSEEMRAHVITLAREMGYSGSKRAQKRVPTSENVGIIVSDRFFSESTFYAGLYRALQLKCTAIGLTGLLEIVSPEAERNCVMPTLITNHKVDGLIFLGEVDRPYLHTVLAAGLPYMLLDFYDDELSGSCVLSDNEAGGYALTRHVLATGRSRIAFVGSILATSSIMARYLGYTKALYRAHLFPRQDWLIEDRDQEGVFIPFKLPEDMPQAFVCNCDEVAFNLVERLKRAGYRIPQDIAVSGYDDYRFSTLCDPKLTTYSVNMEEMAAAAVLQLSHKLHKNRVPAVTNTVPGRLVVRDST